MDDSDITAMFIERLAAMSPEQKLDRVAALTRAVRQLALTRLAEVHPGADERELRLRLASLWLDADVMRDAFGWEPAS